MRMDLSHFVTDMAIEAGEQQGAYDLSEHSELSMGIVRHTLHIKNDELARQIGRDKGVYITYDCPSSVHSSTRVAAAAKGYLARAIYNLAGNLKKTAPVLVVGLGNADISADSLGQRTADGIEVTRQNISEVSRQSVCAFSTSVLGRTGIQSAELASAVADRIKPSLVILVDSLATGNVARVGTSFQISTAGISPGSGVGQDKERIDKSVLKVPTLAIGVPLMLSLRTALYGFVKEFCEGQNMSVNEFELRQCMADKKLSNLVVAPKDIDFMASNAANIISDAINEAFS